jgi:TolB-like protein/Tfp pilus assembly protein PilF
MSATLVFGPFEISTHTRRLLREGQQMMLGARAFDILLALVSHAGELVSKDQLFEWVWPGRVVEENNLQVHVSTLRKLLGAQWIATVPGRGYRFTGQVQQVGAGPAEQSTAIAQTLASRHSIAVLPFTNASGDDSQEYFSDGIAEDVISHLTRSPWLLVVARNSSFTYRSSTASPMQICGELEARYLVTGAVRRAGNQLRVNAELVDGQSGQNLWTQRFDSELPDLFKLQEQIAHSIVSAIEPVALRSEEKRALHLAEHSAADVQHWELLMQARWHFWRSTREHLVSSEQLLLQAMQLNSKEGASLSLMAFIHMSRVWAGWAESSKQSLNEAISCAMRAVALDEQDSFAHFTLGTALSCVGKMDQAIAELEQALRIYPQAAAAAGELGRLLAFSGRSDEAHEFALQAMDASPHDPHRSLWIRTRAIACFVAGQYEEGARFAMQAVAQRPDWFFNHLALAACHALAGHMPQAQAAVAAALQGGSYGLGTLRIGHPFVKPEDFARFVQAIESAGWQAK